MIINTFMCNWRKPLHFSANRIFYVLPFIKSFWKKQEHIIVWTICTVGYNYLFHKKTLVILSMISVSKGSIVITVCISDTVKKTLRSYLCSQCRYGHYVYRHLTIQVAAVLFAPSIVLIHMLFHSIYTRTNNLPIYINPLHISNQ